VNALTKNTKTELYNVGSERPSQQHYRVALWFAKWKRRSSGAACRCVRWREKMAQLLCVGRHEIRLFVTFF